MACKTYTFSRRDRNRYRKVYRYLRKKPKYEYIADQDLTILSGQATFTATAGPITVLFEDCDPTALFLSVPSVVAMACDSESNDTADVNIYATSVSLTQVVFEASQDFTGTVHFQVIGS
jgi:hypothetical protein